MFPCFLRGMVSTLLASMRSARSPSAISRFYGSLIGVQYGEPFVVKETMRVDDITAMGVRSL